MFTGINIFWARLRVGLARAAGRGLKWALRRAGPKPTFSILAHKMRHNARKSDNNLKISIWCHQIQSNATPVVKMFGVLIFMNDLWFAIGATSFTMVHYKLSAAQLWIPKQQRRQSLIICPLFNQTMRFCKLLYKWVFQDVLYFFPFNWTFHALPPPLNKIIIQVPM